MKNSIIQYGLIGGIIVSVLFLGPIVIDADSYMDPEKMKSGEIIGYSIMVLSMLSVYFGIRAYRKNYNKAEFSFLKGNKKEVLVHLLLVNFLLCNFIYV